MASINDTRQRIAAQQERFFANVEIEAGGCWRWKGSSHPGGDGDRAWFFIDGKNLFAARVLFTWLHGPLMNNDQVCHTCDNPMCVNPDHLFLGAGKDNVADMKSKGRGWWQKADAGERKRRSSQANAAQQLRDAYARGEQCSQHKLTEADIPLIRQMLRERIPQHKIAEAFGVAQTTISHIKLGKIWTHIPDEDQPKAA